MTLAGIVPFALALFAWEPHGDGLGGAGLLGPCPFLEATGIPCLGCGGTRAFYFLVHGDTRFLDYNWAWPLVAIGVVAFGALLAVRALRNRPLAGDRMTGVARLYSARPVLMAAVTVGLLMLPWLVALANRDAIRLS